MDRKTYMKNVYSKYWIVARKKKYGFSEYEKNLCYYIGEKISKESKILEVAIGTGFPFGNFFQNRGYKVYGVDIAPVLIEECKKSNIKINCKVGDAENLDYHDNFFSCTYCFNSTSYFDDLCKVIDEMVRVTIPNGMIIFDIQNADNARVNKAYKQRVFRSKGFGLLIQFAVNVAKFFLQRGALNWRGIVHEVPAYPKEIVTYLNDNLQKVQCVILTDGEAQPMRVTRQVHRHWEDEPYLGTVYMGNNCFLRDRKTGNTYNMNVEWYQQTDVLIQNLKHNFPDMNFIGIRLLPNRDSGSFIRRYCGYNGNLFEKTTSSWRKKSRFSFSIVLIILTII